MFLKRIRVTKDGKRHTYWALVKTIRTARGPRHQLVSYLGELSASKRAGWAKLAHILDHRPEPTLPLFEFDGPTEPVPETVDVCVRKVRSERTRDFGDVYLGLLLWRALELDKLLNRLLPRARQEMPGSVMAAILTLARFCEPSSELHIDDTWYERTALDDLLGVPAEAVNKDRLYRTLDRVLPHKPALEKHLKERFTTLFDVRYDLLLYDVTSTYFEGEAVGNPQAQRGYSRDHRPDCKQVCIGLVVTREGLPVAYEVFEGNRNDVTTVEQLVEAMEAKHGQVDRVWVLDRGMISEPNLQFIRQRRGSYVVGTPKAMLKRYQRQLTEQGWREVQEGIEVKLCPGPEGEETFILCRSVDRREKERAIHDRFERRIEQDLSRLAERLQQAKTQPNRAQVERQIGRMLGRNSRAAGLFDIQVTEIKRGSRQGFLKLTWNKRPDWRQWAELSEGCYLLRTNLVGWSAEDLWKTYTQLTQAEAAFRTQKSELRLRPIWHHRQDRVQAHILFSFLAYVLWKTLEQWMSKSGLGQGPRPLIEDLARLKAHDVVLATCTGRELRIRCVAKPDQSQWILLSHLGLAIPTRLGEPRWQR